MATILSQMGHFEKTNLKSELYKASKFARLYGVDFTWPKTLDKPQTQVIVL